MFARVVRGQPNAHRVVSIRPFGMVVHRLGFERHASHERERLAEIGEFVGSDKRVAVQRPSGQPGQRGANFCFYQWGILVCVIAIFLAIAGGIIHRIITKKGIGIKFCQYLAISTGVPALVALGLVGKIGAGSIGAAIGVLVGFAIARPGKDEQ